MTEAVVRARFTEGQFLRAGDLAVEQAHREDAARRHLIGGHTWGVVTGLGLLPGRRTVTVTAGVAVDGHGRMLIVTAPVQVAVDSAEAGERDIWLTSGPSDGDEVPHVCLGAVGVADPHRPTGRAAPGPSSAVGAPPGRWPVFLGRVTWAPEAVQVSEDGRVHVGLIGEVVAAPSGRARLRLGPEPESDDTTGFAVATRSRTPAGGAPEQAEGGAGGSGTGAVETRLAVSQAGALAVPGTTLLRGDVLVQPTPDLPARAHLGIRFRATAEPPAAIPWSFCRTSTTGDRPADQLRIEIGHPGSGGDPTRNLFVVGTRRRPEASPGAGGVGPDGEFQPCLSVDSACTVTFHGGLEVQGLLSESPIRADRADPRFAGAAAESFVQGAVGTANQVDAFFASRLEVSVTAPEGDVGAGPFTFTVTVTNAGSGTLIDGQIHAVVAVGDQVAERTRLIEKLTLAPGTEEGEEHTFAVLATTTASKLTVSVLAVAVGPAHNVVSAHADLERTIVIGGVPS